MIYVSDLASMTAFYCGCLGFVGVESAGDFAVLETPALTLSLVLVPAGVAGRIGTPGPQRRRSGTPVKLGFAVASIAALRPVAAALGGEVDPVATEWDFRGQRRCDCADPEGNVIQLLEPAGTGG